MILTANKRFAIFGYNILIALDSSTGSAAIHFNAIRPSFMPSIHRMNFELLTHSGENITIPLLDPNHLWEHPRFRQDWDVVLIVTGWNSNINETNDALDVLYGAYRLRNINFVVRSEITEAKWYEAFQFAFNLCWRVIEMRRGNSVVSTHQLALKNYFSICFVLFCIFMLPNRCLIQHISSTHCTLGVPSIRRESDA